MGKLIMFFYTIVLTTLSFSCDDTKLKQDEIAQLAVRNYLSQRRSLPQGYKCVVVLIINNMDGVWSITMTPSFNSFIKGTRFMPYNIVRERGVLFAFVDLKSKTDDQTLSKLKEQGLLIDIPNNNLHSIKNAPLFTLDDSIASIKCTFYEKQRKMVCLEESPL